MTQGITYNNNRLKYLTFIIVEVLPLTCFSNKLSVSLHQEVQIDLVNIKNSGEILDKLKARDFNAISLSSYDFLHVTLLYLII